MIGSACFLFYSGCFGHKMVTPYFVCFRSPFLWHFDSGVEVLVWFLETSALGALSHVRGSSGVVSLSPPLFSPLSCSFVVLGSPMVGLLSGALRPFCLIVFFWLAVLLFYLFVFNGDPRLSASSLSVSFMLFPFLSLAFAGASSVCRLFRGVRLCACSFSCWRCRVLCACFVVGVRGGLSFLSVVCLLNVCVQECRCSS